MSLQRGCDLVEYQKKWFGFIAEEEYDHDFNSFTLFGPFNSEKDCDKYMSDNFSNPGGCFISKQLARWQVRAIRKHMKKGRKQTFFSQYDASKLNTD